MFENLLALLCAVFATYGIAVIASEYDGPLGIFYKLRRGKIRGIFECSVCLSPYIALAISIGMSFSIIEFLAIIGLSVLLARNT